GGVNAINTVKIGAINDVILEFNTFRNSNGSHVFITSGLRPLIRFNKFSNSMVMSIAIITGISQQPTTAQIVDNQITSPIGLHAIYTVQSDSNFICRNTINGGLIIGAPGSLTHATTAGTAVTFVSGQNFANASAGQIFIINNGQEFVINTVNSSTSLT